MGKTLNRFATVIPRLQSITLKRRMHERVDRQEILTATAFRNEYESAVRTLLAQETPNIYKGYRTEPGEYVSSEVFRGIFTDLKDDLTTLFGEFDLLMILGESQSIYYRNEVVSKIQIAVNEARREIERMRALHRNALGLTGSIAETFHHGHSERLSYDEDPSLYRRLYADLKLGEPVARDRELVVNIGEEGLVLPLTLEGSIPFHPENNTALNNQPVHGPDTTASDQGLESDSGNNPENIIRILDRQVGTWWEHNVYKHSAVSGGAKFSLRLIISGGLANLNYIQIQGQAGNLTAISYTDPSGVVQAIPLTRPRRIDGPARFRFPEVQVSEISLIFTNQLSEELTFRRDNGDGFLELIPVQRYQFRFDNIQIGKTTYAPTGYYISRTLAGRNQSIFRLLANEADPLPLEERPDGWFGESALVEYDLLYRDYDNLDNITVTLRVPILRSGQQTVKELLYPGDDRAATLRFFISAIDDLRITKNDQELVIDVDFSIRNAPEAEEVLHEIPTIIEFSDELLMNGEFIAWYVPHIKLNASSPNYTDPTGLIAYRSDGSIEITRSPNSRAVRSEVNMYMAMRAIGDKRNTKIISNYNLSIGEASED